MQVQVMLDASVGSGVDTSNLNPAVLEEQVSRLEDVVVIMLHHDK